MYQAIVFLPLLGCIVAGLISLAGARQRHPGANPAAGLENHAHDHGPHTGGGAPSPHGDPAVIAHATHEDHPQEPPAAGSRAAELVTTLFLFVSMVLSWMAFYRVGFGHQDSREMLLAWIYSADLKVDWGIRVDTLTAVMLVVVTTISAFVHLYSIGYMADDPHRPRFFAYLSLFTFDAGARDRGQSRAVVLWLGGRRPDELSAHRLLVLQTGSKCGRHQGLY